MISNKKIIFVTDFFSKEVNGGAELTLDAIYNASPYKNISMIKSERLHPDMLLMPNVHWIFGNYTRLQKPTVEKILQLIDINKIEYSIIEFDYKFCVVRNDLVHNYELYTKSKDNNYGFCKCHSEIHGIVTTKLFANARKVHFMSQEQMNLILRKLPALTVKKENFRVQWSTWSKEHLEFIDSLYALKNKDKKEESDKVWAVQENEHWLKGKENSIVYAKENKLNLTIIPSMKYEDFLKELIKYDGFMFKPNAWDTCPRVVIEAKLLGLETSLNNKVQIESDPIFLQTRTELRNYLENNSKDFWDSYKE